MIEKSICLSEREASQVLRINEHFLESLRERGDLKPGYHWKSSTDPDQLPWKPKACYFISACKEIVDHSKDNYASFEQMSA